MPGIVDRLCGAISLKFNTVFGHLSKLTHGALSPNPPRVRTTIRTKRPLKPLRLDRIFAGPGLLQTPRSHQYYIAFAATSHDNLYSARRTPHLGAPQKMKCFLQFVSTPTADTPGTMLLLHFDDKRYLIGNVAEGAQRSTIQRKVGLTKVRDIILTGKIDWSSTGGVLGMVLTLADSLATSREEQKRIADETRKRKGLTGPSPTLEKAWLNLHGGRNLTHTLATARRFVFRKGMPLRTNEYRANQDGLRVDCEPMWQDDLIKMWAMIIEPETQNGRRKRSHGEISGDESTSIDGIQETSAEQKDRYDQMRKAVLGDMFNSSWLLDTLTSTKLSQVKQPAAMFIRDGEGKIQEYRGPVMDQAGTVPDIEVLVRGPWPAAKILNLPPTTPSASSTCYIIKNHTQRGKFNFQKAVELKVKKGPDFRKLTLGKSVIAENGAEITPDMVMGESKPGTGFAVVELPDIAYLGPLLSRDEWSSTEVMSGVEVVIWILGPGVLQDPRLQEFMQEHKELKHIVSSPDCCSNYLALESAATRAIQLHLLDPERFPIPKFDHETMTKPTEGRGLYDVARSGKTIQLEPSVVIQDESIVPYLDTTNVIKSAPKDVLALAEIARKQTTSPEFQSQLDANQKDLLGKDAEVITLGTGSSLPSKYRNVSATLLRVPGFGSYLFDCGENTLGQMKRVFGTELPLVLRDLKAIWISHLHADHHLGTVSVIKAWAEETKTDHRLANTKLVVASDDGMIQWLREYTEVEDYGYNRLKLITMGRQGTFNYRFNPEQTQKFGLSSIRACSVEHCHGALAVVLDFPNQFKVAYSGDCRPSQNFAKIGDGATLLIHEATFETELQSDAIAKKHSTTAEALEVGRQMNARRILLTHFSQRYQKIPVMDSHAGKDQVAIVAFDYMRVKIEDFAKMEAFKPALMKLYEDEEPQAS